MVIDLHWKIMFFYGSVANPFSYLHKLVLVISSESEGLPLSLIEYGWAAFTGSMYACRPMCSVLEGAKTGYWFRHRMPLH